MNLFSRVNRNSPVTSPKNSSPSIHGNICYTFIVLWTTSRASVSENPRSVTNFSQCSEEDPLEVLMWQSSSDVSQNAVFVIRLPTFSFFWRSLNKKKPTSRLHHWWIEIGSERERIHFASFSASFVFWKRGKNIIQ